LLQIVIDCKLRVSFIIRIEGVESSKIFNAMQHKQKGFTMNAIEQTVFSTEIKLFNSVYLFGKEELGLNDTNALALAQFIVDNQDVFNQG
jgi:hypothetical protein